MAVLEVELENIERVSRDCGYCNRELDIPLGVVRSLEVMKIRGVSRLTGQYDGFYVGKTGKFYCSKKCFDDFCED
ncbi:MAG: hypothetical protein Q7S74_00830 [Nanoarchaeota archaeon]|nr:hypothetical protein [Nanoarchaeota archaeon]